MKKYLVVLAAAFLVVALASPSFAQFKSWGHIEVETIWQTNATSFNKDLSDNRRHVAERYRFYLQYGDPKTVRAVIGFEADSNQWGETGSAGVTTSVPANATGLTVGPSTGARNKMGSLATDQVALELKHAYLDFVVPGTPVSVMAGLQNFAIGGTVGRYFMNTDGPAVKVTGAFAPHTVEAFWIKEYKTNAYKDNDADLYGIRYLLSQKMFNVEAWAVYELDRRTQAEAWTWQSAATTSTTTDYYLRQTLTARTYDAKKWWLGVNVPVMVANFTITPTFVYQFGQQKDFWSGTSSDIDISAWLANLEVKYQIGPGLSVTGQGYYSTGGDTGNDTKYGLYSVPNGSEAINVFGNGWSVFYFENTELTYYGHKREAYGGFWLGRLTATYSPLAWLELQGSYIYIGDTSKGSTGTNSTTGLTNNTIGAKSDSKNEDYVGSELNMIATVKIYDNIRYKLGFGYFLPGGAYDKFYSPYTKDADNAWNFLTNLNYAF